MNFDSLNNISEFVLNETLINNSREVISNIVYNAEPASQGWYGLILLMAMFVFTVYLLYRDDGLFKLDFIQAGNYASFFTLSVGILLFSINVITNFRSLMWFAILLLVFWSSRWLAKQN